VADGLARRVPEAGTEAATRRSAPKEGSMTKDRLVSAAVFALILAGSTTATAQAPSHGAPTTGARGPGSAASASTIAVSTADYTERQVDGGQVVEFPGDPLPADGLGVDGDLIRAVPRVLRAGLIRPRLNFIPELLKTVENL
jgi:hypothetical protein